MSYAVMLHMFVKLAQTRRDFASGGFLARQAQVVPEFSTAAAGISENAPGGFAARWQTTKDIC